MDNDRENVVMQAGEESGSGDESGWSGVSDRSTDSEGTILEASSDGSVSHLGSGIRDEIKIYLGSQQIAQTCLAHLTGAFWCECFKISCHVLFPIPNLFRILFRNLRNFKHVRKTQDILRFIDFGKKRILFLFVVASMNRKISCVF